MKCQHTWRLKNPNYSEIGGSKYIEIPCGKCIACRINKTNEKTEQLWAEYTTSGKIGCFITLTYSDLSCNEMGLFVYKNNKSLVKAKTKSGTETVVTTLRKKHAQDFLKRLRINLERNGLNPHFKYVLCGEYGGELGRCHYHLAIIGYGTEIADYIRQAWSRKYEIDNKYHLIGLVEVKPIVSKGAFRYVLKYMDKEQAEHEYYEEYEKYGIEKPFHTISKGMGVEFYEKHWNEIINNTGKYKGEKNKMISIPKYYQNKMGVMPRTEMGELREEWEKKRNKKLTASEIMELKKAEDNRKEELQKQKLKLEKNYYEPRDLYN